MSRSKGGDGLLTLGRGDGLQSLGAWREMVLQIAPKLSRGCCVMPARRLETVESIARGTAHYRRPLSGWSIIVHIARHEIPRVLGVSGMSLGERRIEFCDEHYGCAKRYASQWAACDWLERAE
jgi:hypothetical protein